MRPRAASARTALTAFTSANGSPSNPVLIVYETVAGKILGVMRK